MKQRIICEILIYFILLGFLKDVCVAKEKYDPSTLVFPPYLHTYGIRKATKYHLFLFMQNHVKFRNPQGFAVVRLNCWDDSTTKNDDDEVTVYGVNSGQNNIIFNSSMTTLGVYGLNETKNNRLNHPHGIAANSNGNVYVADTGNNRIVYLHNNGKSLKFVLAIGCLGSNHGQFNQPHDVDIDSDGNIYIADTFNDRIQIFDKNHTFKYSFNYEIEKKNKLLHPTSIIAANRQRKWSYYHEEFICVIDSSKSRIIKFSLKGDLIKIVRMKKLLNKNIELLYIAYDYYGNIYITDKKNHCIHKFDHNLIYLTSYGRKGKKDKEFREPRGIAVYRRFGQVFIAEKNGAQYYWVGVDYNNFSVNVDKNGKIFVRYTLTEPAFITVDILNDNNELVTRIWHEMYKSSGQQFDVWNKNIVNRSDNFLLKEQLKISEKYKNLHKVPSGKYKIHYKFQPTYSSYKYFFKEITNDIIIE